MKLPSLFLSSSLALFAAAAQATELVYSPTNPAFGGSPLNGPYLLSNAQSQNDHSDPDAPSFGSTSQTSSLDRFTSSLQSRLLSQLLTDVGNGAGGSLETQATVSTDWRLSTNPR